MAGTRNEIAFAHNLLPPLHPEQNEAIDIVNALSYFIEFWLDHTQNSELGQEASIVQAL